MARTKISEFSSTAADNTDIDGIDIAEGCAPSGINNAIRTLMADLKDMQTGASGDTFTFASLNATTANIDGGTIDGTTIGGTTPAAGSFTTLSASSTVSGNGFSNYLASPPAIGGSSAAAGTFTNLAYTGTLTGGTGIINIGSGQLYKDATGNVGIGTSSPGARLDVRAGNGTGGISGATSGTWAAQIVMNQDVTAYNGLSVQSRWATDTGIIFEAAAGYNGSTVGYYPTYTARGDGVHIWKTVGSGENPERMRINSNGNVGIGTNNPSEKLHVAGSIKIESSYQWFVAGAASTAESYAGFLKGGTSTAVGFIGTDGGGILGGGSGDNFGIRAEGALLFLSAGTLRSQFTSAGDFLIAKSSTDFGTAGARFLTNGEFQLTAANIGALQVNRISSTGVVAFWYYNGTNVGSISTDGSGTSYNTSSDYRLKNIEGELTNSGGFIDALRPVYGTWKADGSTFIGLLAHEVDAISQTKVATGTKDEVDADGNPVYQAMDYSNAELIANLIAEVKSLRKRVAQLEGA